MPQVVTYVLNYEHKINVFSPHTSILSRNRKFVCVENLGIQVSITFFRNVTEPLTSQRGTNVSEENNETRTVSLPSSTDVSMKLHEAISQEYRNSVGFSSGNKQLNVCMSYD